MGKYRTRLQIIADMLSVVNDNEGARRTQVMYQANLSYRLLRRYLDEIVESGLVECNEDHCYELTPKGLEFLERFREYFERRQSVEQRLDKILGEKEVLEDTFLTKDAMPVNRLREGKANRDE
jgi:predicted transcriptional regulator